MEDMALEFGASGVGTKARRRRSLRRPTLRRAGDMLKETLDKMGAQLELSSSENASMTRRLDDFKVAQGATT